MNNIKIAYLKKKYVMVRLRMKLLKTLTNEQAYDQHFDFQTWKETKTSCRVLSHETKTRLRALFLTGPLIPNLLNISQP